jgi:hypothetical protein
MIDKSKQVFGVEMGHLLNVELWDLLNGNFRLLKRVSSQDIHHFDIIMIILIEQAT